MPSLVGQVYGYLALAVVNGPAGTFNSQRGFSSILKNAVGDYTLNFQDEANNTDYVVVATPRNVGGCGIAVQVSSASVRVTTFDPAGVLSDLNFSVAVIQIAP